MEDQAEHEDAGGNNEKMRFRNAAKGQEHYGALAENWYAEGNFVGSQAAAQIAMVYGQRRISSRMS